MKKGKTLTSIVLIAEIACIAVLHAVKINQSEKTAKEITSRNATAESSQESKSKTTYSLAVLK